MFNSLGLKRKIASALAVVLELVRQIPEAAPFIAILEQIIAGLGGAAVAHASAAGTVNKFKLATVSSVLSFILGMSYALPALAPYRQILEKLSTIVGAAALGSAVSKTAKKK